MGLPTKVACVGAGVIGSAWAARFLLNGVDVAIADPDPELKRKVDAVLANARRAYDGLALNALPPEGKLTLTADLAAAVAGAELVIESVPERIDIKHATFAAIEQAVGPDVIIASSTSGYKPSDLRAGCTHPERLIVAHPFNPVYLLPLVEIVGVEGGDRAVIEWAKAIYTAAGMKPLVVRKEIDAFIADRFLEAVWREALWLVKDDIATTEEIDDAIRYGFGLRWAQMGLFETYRTAGGEAGMRHFISQFGPALQWPWTKLMDVPELTEELIDKIADQSDAQSGKYSIAELLTIRDDNLIAIFRGLQSTNWGAGETLNAYQIALEDRARGGS